MRTALLTRAAGRRDEAALHEIVQRILGIDGRQSGDRRTAARDDDLGTGRHALEVLAQTIVKLSDPNLVDLPM